MRLGKQWGFLVLLVAAAGIYFGLNLQAILNFDVLKAQQSELDAWRSAEPLLAALICFAGYVAVAALSLPGAAVMTVAVGALFGLVWGTVIVSFASTVGATLAFLVSRRLFSDLVRSRFSETMAAIDAGTRRDGGFYLFTLRVVPAVPFFVVNLVMGLTAIRASTFVWVSQLAMLPGTIVYVNAGTQLAHIDSLRGTMSTSMIWSLVLLGVFPLAARKLVDWIRVRRIYAGYRKPSHFDRNLVVIGAGSAGLVTAYIAAAVKAKVTLVEKYRLGGDCLNTGCVPSKALIRTATFISHVRRAKELGARMAQVKVEFSEVMERVQDIVRAVSPHDSAERYEALGVDVVRGSARIVTPWEVEIARDDGSIQKLTTRSIIVAAGAHPLIPPIPGIDRVPILTSDNLWELRELPSRLLVLGGGPIGCELAQSFARLGSQVTQVEMSPRLLMREDPEISAFVAGRFRAEGIRVLAEHKALRVEERGVEKVLVAESTGGQVEVPFDTLLVAVGRVANLQGFGLQELGVATGRTIEVNDYLQTNFPNIYAAGDVAGPFQFTHTAAHQAWYAAVNSLFDPVAKFRADYRVIPWATFVDPEVARVGLNETEAREKGVAYEVVTYGLDDLDRAITDSEAHGFIKVLTAPGKDRILGVSIVGHHAADLIAEYVLAMKNGIGLNKILSTVHIYPTLVEVNKYAAGAWKRAHAPKRLLGWAERFHSWRRRDLSRVVP